MLYIISIRIHSPVLFCFFSKVSSNGSVLTVFGKYFTVTRTFLKILPPLPLRHVLLPQPDNSVPPFFDL